ncbi:MAG TPA: thioredoxin domain-containing protein [Flavobacterium sp.]|jgi:thioredoxin
MKIKNLFPFIFSLTVLSCHAQTSKGVETIAAKDFSEKINTTSNPQIIDVRTPDEFTGGHIDDAVNVNWNSGNFVADMAKYDKTKPVFVYCLSGGRSKQVATKLEALGFKTIYDLQGGILKWNAAGLSQPSDKVIGMTTADYNKLIDTKKKVLIHFYAEWCAPCKKMAPYVLKMQQEMANDVVIIRLDADKNKTLMKTLNIQELPALFVYKNKTVQWKHSGFISEKDLKKQLQ